MLLGLREVSSPSNEGVDELADAAAIVSANHLGFQGRSGEREILGMLMSTWEMNGTLPMNFLAASLEGKTGTIVPEVEPSPDGV